MARIYVGNIPYETKESDLQGLFQEFGSVGVVRVVTDPATGRSRGFAFVEMTNAAEARAAIEALDGKEFAGRSLKVNEARPRENRPERSGGGGGGGGGGKRGGRW